MSRGVVAGFLREKTLWEWCNQGAEGEFKQIESVLIGRKGDVERPVNRSRLRVEEVLIRLGSKVMCAVKGPQWCDEYIN